MSCQPHCGHGGMLCGEPDCNYWPMDVAGPAQHTTLVDATDDMALIILAQDLKDRIYTAAAQVGLSPSEWLEAALENLEGRKA